MADRLSHEKRSFPPKWIRDHGAAHLLKCQSPGQICPGLFFVFRRRNTGMHEACHNMPHAQHDTV